MKLYYIRHGEPIYNPDSLTKLGEEQAQALVNRLRNAGINKVFSSSSDRAKLTAKPFCDEMKLDCTILDWCHERYVWDDFCLITESKRLDFCFEDDSVRKLFLSKDMEKLGFEWYSHPFFGGGKWKSGIERVQTNCDNFLEKLGYRHNREERTYTAIRPNNDKVALFAHEGFGTVFLSVLMDIPYPMFASKFDMDVSCVTVIDFSGEDTVIPKILTYSNDSHLFANGMNTLW